MFPLGESHRHLIDPRRVRAGGGAEAPGRRRLLQERVQRRGPVEARERVCGGDGLAQRRELEPRVGADGPVGRDVREARDDGLDGRAAAAVGHEHRRRRARDAARVEDLLAPRRDRGRVERAARRGRARREARDVEHRSVR